jgi:hypothetical protein
VAQSSGREEHFDLRCDPTEVSGNATSRYHMKDLVGGGG